MNDQPDPSNSDPAGGMPPPGRDQEGMLLADLPPGAKGTFLIFTASSSVYYLDLDERLVARLPGEGWGADDPNPIPVSRLRRDGELRPLLAFEGVQRDQRMHLLIDVRGDGWATFRETSAVVLIRSLTPADPPPTGKAGVPRPFRTVRFDPPASPSGGSDMPLQ